MGAIAALGLGWVAIDGAVDAVEGVIAENDTALFFGDTTASGGRGEAEVAVGKGIPGNFFRVGFDEQVVAAEEDAFGASKETATEVTDFVEDDEDVSVPNKWFTDVPEEFYFALVGICAVDVHFAHGDVVSFWAPGLATVGTAHGDYMLSGFAFGTGAGSYYRMSLLFQGMFEKGPY